MLTTFIIQKKVKVPSNFTFHKWHVPNFRVCCFKINFVPKFSINRSFKHHPTCKKIIGDQKNLSCSHSIKKKLAVLLKPGNVSELGFEARSATDIADALAEAFNTNLSEIESVYITTHILHLNGYTFLLETLVC